MLINGTALTQEQGQDQHALKALQTSTVCESSCLVSNACVRGSAARGRTEECKRNFDSEPHIHGVRVSGLPCFFAQNASAANRESELDLTDACLFVPFVRTKIVAAAVYVLGLFFIGLYIAEVTKRKKL